MILVSISAHIKKSGNLFNDPGINQCPYKKVWKLIL